MKGSEQDDALSCLRDAIGCAFYDVVPNLVFQLFEPSDEVLEDFVLLQGRNILHGHHIGRYSFDYPSKFV
jgi:hypothetical protein